MHQLDLDLLHSPAGEAYLCDFKMRPNQLACLLLLLQGSEVPAFPAVSLHIELLPARPVPSGSLPADFCLRLRAKCNGSSENIPGPLSKHASVQNSRQLSFLHETNVAGL